jgi:vitamin B12 transporter
MLNFSILIGQSRIKVEGSVRDGDNNPLPYVNIFIQNSSEGGFSDEKGNFSFFSKKKGSVKLIASMIGFSKYIKEYTIEGKNLKIDIVLEKEAVKMSETVVTASSFGSEKKKGIVISSREVLSTPGGAADIFQSLKTLPGLTNVSESAELYIRGGDPIETVTMLDQATLYHPYTFESAHGGIFSNLTTTNIKGMYFSSGGFSAKYGNALSGVLDIESKNSPSSATYNIGLSMANISLSAESPIINDVLGIRFDARQSFTKPLLWLNGALDQMVVSPTSRNITGSIIFNYSSSGRLKLSVMLADDDQSIKINRAEYNGVFDGYSNNSFINLQHTDLFSNILLKTSISYNRYKNEWKLGVLDLDKVDEMYKFRSDLEYQIFAPIKMFCGIEAEKRISNYYGILPVNDYNISPDAISKNINSEISVLRVGAYAEFEIQSLLGFNNSSLIFGGRFDNHPDLNIRWFDPRVSLAYKLNSSSILKAGFGIYHQLPDPRLFSETDGNPDLKSMRAIHYILSYDNNLGEENNLRIELYHKVYNDLPLENDITNYDNNGHGYASGIDIILKGNLSNNIKGWISYGYINTKRKWMDFQELSPSTYDITHNLSMIIKYAVSPEWEIGINYKLASGKPYTPINDVRFQPEAKVYEPIYGIKNSERYPTYHRLDLRLTHFNQLFGKYFTVFYLEFMNVLGIKNIFEYTYNADYSQRSEIISYFGRRTLVFGMNVNI